MHCSDHKKNRKVLQRVAQTGQSEVAKEILTLTPCLVHLCVLCGTPLGLAHPPPPWHTAVHSPWTTRGIIIICNHNRLSEIKKLCQMFSSLLYNFVSHVVSSKASTAQKMCPCHGRLKLNRTCVYVSRMWHAVSKTWIRPLGGSAWRPGHINTFPELKGQKGLPITQVGLGVRQGSVSYSPCTARQRKHKAQDGTVWRRGRAITQGGVAVNTSQQK